jgi:CRP-like cAMP-binding protein
MAPDIRARAEAILRRSAWLHGHGPDLIAPLLTHGSFLTLRAGEWVHGEGDDSSGLIVVLTGTLQVLVHAHGGREVLVSQLGPGSAMGQARRYGGGPRLVTLICAEDGVVLQATDRALGRIAVEQPHVWQALSALFYVQMSELTQALAEIAGLGPRQRLAARLLRLAGAEGLSTIVLKQHALAEMIGLTRKTVNVFLADFERQGLIRRGYGAVTLLDVAGLQRIAAS